MAHSEKFSLCYGTGNRDGQGENPGGTSEICCGCSGKGWVEVSDEL